jgi:hypothetical protein
MKQSPPRETDSHSVDQKISRLICNPGFVTVFTRPRNWALPQPAESSPRTHTLFLHDIFSPKAAAKWSSLLLRIPEVSGSNLRPEPTNVSLVFSPQHKCGHSPLNKVTTVSFHILSNSLRVPHAYGPVHICLSVCRISPRNAWLRVIVEKRCCNNGKQVIVATIANEFIVGTIRSEAIVGDTQQWEPRYLLQRYPRPVLAHNNDLGSHHNDLGYHCCLWYHSWSCHSFRVRVIQVRSSFESLL